MRACERSARERMPRLWTASERKINRKKEKESLQVGVTETSYFAATRQEFCQWPQRRTGTYRIRG